ncbi:hypothetical protein KP509_03G085100 [Ceratopteris richardii]|uniref:Ubiquitin carboxyl-terminal hydrolase n=1 Tax=Ceratopteris richardii TaxID=49495 RepID=A0A8T2V1P8_CERRI|nr:hypothetical protein KP509_03G085100 [Ceratopteris richardii]
MASAAAQEPAQFRITSISNGFSHVAASMASMFHHQTFFPYSVGKASSHTLSGLRAMESSCYQLEINNIYGFLDESPPVVLQCSPMQNIGAGLANLGNTCFLNSVLQCLTYTPPLAAHLQAGLHHASCKVKGFCVMCALERHVKGALKSNGKVISPNHFVNNLQSISRSFQLYQQEDAHEYMRYLIEALQRCSSMDSLGGRNLIELVFGGRLRSQVKCSQCLHCSNKYDPFLDLSLEIEGVDSFDTALAHFTATEVLDGENKYHCSMCKTKVRAQKQFTIDKAPPVLTVQFKRFSSVGCYGEKIDKKIHFEKEFSLKPFVNGCEDEELAYSLYAVLVHSGWSTHSGHYYCFVRTAGDKWHIMDDSQVSPVSESIVLAQKAYILFYVRKVGSSFSSLINHVQNKPDDDHVQNKCDDEHVQNKPDDDHVQNKHDDDHVQNKPDDDHVQNKPDDDLVQSKPDDDHVQNKPDDDHVQNKPDDIVTLSSEVTNHSEVSEDLISGETPTNRTGDCIINTGNCDEPPKAANQIHSPLTTNHNLRESCLMSDESQSSIVLDIDVNAIFPTSDAIFPTSDAIFPTSDAIEERLRMVEYSDAVVPNSFDGNSSCKAMSRLYSSKDHDVVCEQEEVTTHPEDAEESRHLRDQSVCTDDDVQGSCTDACSACDDTTNTDLEDEQGQADVFDCERWGSIFNIIMSPISRIAQAETARHNVFGDLGACAKLCFWSCIWPSL